MRDVTNRYQDIFYYFFIQNIKFVDVNKCLDQYIEERGILKSVNGSGQYEDRHYVNICTYN